MTAPNNMTSDQYRAWSRPLVNYLSGNAEGKNENLEYPTPDTSSGDSIFKSTEYENGTGTYAMFSSPDEEYYVYLETADEYGADILTSAPAGKGQVSMSTHDEGSWLTVNAGVDQTHTLIDIRDSSGAVIFSVGVDGLPQLKSPNGTFYKLKVADNGTLSTEAVV